MSKTTIVLADDHHVVRQGLRLLLEAEPEFSVVGEAADGLEVAELVERVKPKVVVLDLIMPGLNGLEVARQLRQRSPHTRIVILSMYADKGYVLQALKNGVAAYVLKDATTEELVQAVREAAAGRHYLSRPLSQRAIDAYVQKAETAGALDPYDTLTTREREVLQLSAEGYSNARVAARLSISPRTAETHRSNLLRKLGLHTQTDLVLYAVQRGMLPAEELRRGQNVEQQSGGTSMH